jgi:hypothetical protein
MAVPVNLTAPIASGTPIVGGVIATTEGSWEGSPTKFAFVWFRSAKSESGFTTVSGAAASTYALTDEDAGQFLKCDVRASNASGNSAFVFSNFLGPVERPTIPAAAVLSEPVDDTLFVKLTTAEGGSNRLSGIEDQAENIATGITTSNTAPGGHRSGGLNLLRDPRRDFPDLNFIDDVVIYGRTKPLGRNVFEGMAEQFPAQLADSSSIAINAVGNQALLSENEAWKALYVDLGFGGWGEIGLARKQALAGAAQPQGKISLSSGDDGLIWTVPSGQTLSANERTEAVYRSAAGCPIAAIGYKGTRVKNWSSFEAPNVYASAEESFPSFTTTALTLDGSAHVAELPSPQRFALLIALVLSAVSPEAGTMQAYSALAAYGQTGVPRREIPGQLPGVYAHDVLAHIVSTGAPDLNYTIGGDGSIVPNTSFVMPDFAPTEPGKPWDAIEKLNAYFLNNFGVWDNKEFFWKPWDPEDVNWQISIAGGAQWSPVGRQAVTLLNGLVVNYTDAEGISRCAGPPGSGCDYESPLLVNLDPTNPYTRRGRKRWGTLNVGFPLAYPTTAFQVGSVVLAESMMPQRSGALTIRPLGPGHVPSITHPTMGRLPVWALRAGDFATLMDWPVPEALRVTEVDYTHDTKTLTAQLDSGAARLTAILERTGSSLTV